MLKSNINEIRQKSESTFKVWNFWMIQSFTHFLGERWGSKYIGFRMMFPTLIFNRSLSLIDSCFQQNVNVFTRYSPLSLLQTILGLVCLFSILACYAWVLAVFFSLTANYYKAFDTNGVNSHDQNLVLLRHILRISILKISKKNSTFWHSTKHWKVESKANKQKLWYLVLKLLLRWWTIIKKIKRALPVRWSLIVILPNPGDVTSG